MELLIEGSGYTVLTEEPNLQRAHWIAGGVEAAGIPVHVEENNLQDEFAVAQKLLGGIRFRVLVPEDRLDEARTVFLALSQPIPDDPAFHDEEDDEALEDLELHRGDSVMTFGLILLIAFLALPVLFYFVVPAIWRALNG